jgi:predicted nucleic acid-binding protein
LNLLVDSVVLIDHLSGNTHATEFLAQNRHKASVSVITRAEVLVGAREHDIAAITRLLDALPTLGIDREAADSAATLRREHNLRLPDAFQAALAIPSKPGGVPLRSGALRALAPLPGEGAYQPLALRVRDFEAETYAPAPQSQRDRCSYL